MRIEKTVDCEKNEGTTMNFLLSHWRCIVPAVFIAVVLLIQNKNK
jgi:hypothetical protein